MAIVKDVEKRNCSLLEPFVDQKKDTDGRIENEKNGGGGLGMVLFSTAIAVCGSFVFGCCYSVFGSILNIGAMIGAITSGRIADFLGRKEALRLSSIICIAGWIAIFGSILLDSGRFLTAYVIGIVSYVVPIFIAEITPKELKGALASANQFFIVLGIMVIYSVGACVKWRILALTGIIPYLVMVVGLFFIPESPRWQWLVANLNLKHHLKNLGANVDISEEETEIQVAVGLMAFQQIAGINGIIFYADQIFASAGVPPNVGSILYSSLQVLITTFVASLIDRTGRRPLLLVSACGLLLSNLLIGTSFLLKEHHLASGLVPILAIAGVMLYKAFFSLGMGAIPWVLMSELFPLHLKGIAGSLVTLVNWSGAWFISFTFNYLMSWSSFGTFFLYACICLCNIFFIIKMVLETTGRTLEEIQASVN